MTESELTAFRIPTPLVKQIETFKEEHKKEGYTTKAEVIRQAIREFIGKYNGGNNNYQHKQSQLSDQKQKEGENKKDV